MKLKSLLASLLLLLLLNSLQAANASTAAMTAGTFWTATWTGSISVISQPNGINDSAFSFTGPDFTASDGGVQMMVNTVDAQKGKHSTIIGLVLFNDPHHKDALGYATFRGTIPLVGVPSVSLEIVDAMNANSVLFTSGAVPQPITRGGLFISAAIVKPMLPMQRSVARAAATTATLHTEGAPSDSPPPFVAPGDILR